jgi:hypothetical protein
MFRPNDRFIASNDFFGHSHAQRLQIFFTTIESRVLKDAEIYVYFKNVSLPYLQKSCRKN